VIGGRCPACAHKGWFDRWEEQRRRGKRFLVVDLAPKLLCKSCGNRMGNTLILGKLRR
jgi:hypothetical protein